MTNLYNKYSYYFRYFFRYILRPRAFLSKNRVAGFDSYSHAAQDLFVLLMHSFKLSGSYVEIGAQDPIKNSNTYLLEKDYGWRGLSLELREDYSLYCNLRRSNPCYQLDAITADYDRLFKDNHLPERVDYLQVDIDPASACLAALKKIPHANYRFSVITFEHDAYQGDLEVMLESRKFLENLGYVLLAKNVNFKGLDFEDWWIDPLCFPNLSVFDGLDLNGRDCFEIIELIQSKV